LFTLPSAVAAQLPKLKATVLAPLTGSAGTTVGGLPASVPLKFWLYRLLALLDVMTE
jgi:hypothetical protein